jgi:hypothetical protein
MRCERRGERVQNLLFPMTLEADPLEDEGLACLMCGIGPGETDTCTGQIAQLYVGYGMVHTASLGSICPRTICSICWEGLNQLNSDRSVEGNEQKRHFASL